MEALRRSSQPIEQYGLSRGRACRLVGLRSSLNYMPRRRDDSQCGNDCANCGDSDPRTPWLSALSCDAAAGGLAAERQTPADRMLQMGLVVRTKAHNKVGGRRNAGASSNQGERKNG
jgi:hypothetical protein